MLNVKPAPGRKVRDPITKRHLPADRFTAVPANTYWTRRVQAGDVVQETAAPKPAKSAARSVAKTEPERKE